jgi:hypothetical protein
MGPRKRHAEDGLKRSGATEWLLKGTRPATAASKERVPWLRGSKRSTTH